MEHMLSLRIFHCILLLKLIKTNFSILKE